MLPSLLTFPLLPIWVVPAIILMFFPSDAVIACGIGPGTVSEIALALKANKQVIFLTDEKKSFNFFEQLSPQLVSFATNPEDAISIIKMILNDDN